MADFNRVILIGRLTRDPEKSYTTTGTAISKFGLATNNGFGENKKTVFVDVTTWGKTAEFVTTYFTKGKEILVEGRLEFDSWESKEGEKRSKLYVTGERISFAGGKSESSSSSAESNIVSHESSAINKAPSPVEQLSDADIPF
mgnify:CR=1 FL=1